MPRTPRSSRRAAGSSVGLQRTSEPRMVQLEEENDHHRMTALQHRQLVREKLDYLKGLVKEIEADNWKYAPKERVPNHLTKSLAWKPAALQLPK
eukprot:scaffold3410_cov158-Amphora_coffeaeformis.AAC.7